MMKILNVICWLGNAYKRLLVVVYVIAWINFMWQTSSAGYYVFLCCLSYIMNHVDFFYYCCFWWIRKVWCPIITKDFPTKYELLEKYMWRNRWTVFGRITWWSSSTTFTPEFLSHFFCCSSFLFPVEGSLSSSKKRKKAEESKLKLSEGITPSLNQQNYGLKGGDWVNR